MIVLGLSVSIFHAYGSCIAAKALFAANTAGQFYSRLRLLGKERTDGKSHHPHSFWICQHDGPLGRGRCAGLSPQNLLPGA